MEFVRQVNAKHGPVIPTHKAQFTEWWHGYYPSLPPRLANECIWLYVDDAFPDEADEKVKMVPRYEGEQVETFVNDDEGYLRWLKQNASGFVVNSYNKPVPEYLIMHRATCWTISTDARTNWTTTGFIKICSSDKTELEMWAAKEVGGKPHHCGVCNP